MRIKRIDLCGFKSFCDQATVDLQQPMTGVVGPNGCGKSNIVDALRWAMGEQSARHLRGKSMEDVIFNGSDSRGPAGMAEVSITFENDQRSLSQYLAYSEIKVTRRLHRDGTSEYLINKLPVRLRDITNLFLGTGVGTKAYSIIEQGRVGLIVSSKPEERRYFIEEAAGITKYRRRRHLAERKIDATRQNLLRVSDVLDEIGKRLGSLRRQAQKAERYKRYKEEMRDIELWSASHRLLDLIAATKVVDGEIARDDEQREAAVLELEQREVELEAIRLSASELERQLSELQEELYQRDNRIKLNESRIEFQGREAEELQRRAEQSHGEIEELRRQLTADDAQREEVNERVERWRSQRAEQQVALSGRQEVLESLRKALGEVEAALEEERREVGDAERKLARTEANSRALTQRRSDIQDQLSRRRDEGERALDRRSELQGLAGDIDAELRELTATNESLVQRREEAEGKLVELRQRSERGEAELEVLRTELHRRRSRLTSLQEIQARYEGLGSGTRAVMQRHNGSSRDEGILGVVADMLDAPATYETALESVLGHRLGAVIVESESVGVEAIAYLKEQALGRSSFIARASHRSSVLTKAPVGFTWQSGTSVCNVGGGLQVSAQTARTIPVALPGVHGPILSLIACEADYGRVADALLGDVLVVEDLERAMTLWEDLADQTLVTLDGEILEPDGTVTGGSQDAERSGVLQQKREIKELRAIIEELQTQYDEALNRQVSVKSEIANLEQLLDELKRDQHQGEKEILAREKDLGRLRAELESLVERQRELDEEAAQLGQGLEQLEQLQSQLRGELAQTEIKHWIGSDILYLLSHEKKRLASLAADASAAVTDVRVALAQAETGCQAVEGQLAQLEQARRERIARIEKLEGDSGDGLAKAADLRASVSQMQQELTTLVTERAEVQDRLAEDRQAYEAKVEELSELEGGLKGLRSKTNELAAQLGKLQLRRSELKMARQHLDEQIWERYHEELARVAGDYHLRPPVTKDRENRMEQLRQLIFRMGEINLTAIEEFAELNERFEFLSTHRQDLESALGQLQRAIQKINRTCRERFVETFELVNQKFQEVFPRLFKGGKAKLVLTEADDVLQGGVEIVAQPPGKKLVSLNMMSGGEKALTATSLIFAMFLVKPTPFCLLDEVDAPLDEANVIRFRDLIGQLSVTSQFIIITHNHTTMEVADRLYGVTMEEPGVSKLLSVNLTEAQKVAA